MKEVAGTLTEEKKKEKQWAQYLLSKLGDESVTPEDTFNVGSVSTNRTVRRNIASLNWTFAPFLWRGSNSSDSETPNERHEAGDQFPKSRPDSSVYSWSTSLCVSKMVQWKWPASHGEYGYAVVLGRLSIEMALRSVLGDLLGGFGWTAALTEAKVASSGEADSFLKTVHLTRTRYDELKLKQHLIQCVLWRHHTATVCIIKLLIRKCTIFSKEGYIHCFLKNITKEE